MQSVCIEGCRSGIGEGEFVFEKFGGVGHAVGALAQGDSGVNAFQVFAYCGAVAFLESFDDASHGFHCFCAVGVVAGADNESGSDDCAACAFKASHPGAEGGESTSGYVNIAINLPSVGAQGSRAGQANDNFDDGLASEYAVTSAHLVLFSTDDEATATVRGVFTFKDLKPWNEDATIENVTTSAKSVIKIDAPSNINFGALVVLNDPKAEKHFIVGKSFNDLFGASSVVGESVMNNGGKFFMTNAPMYTAGTGKTLATIPANQVYNSYESALQATPIEIFVERGVAKVNVTTATNLKNDVEIDGTTYQATVIGWSLDITNKWSYMVRNIDGFDTWKDYTAAG